MTTRRDFLKASAGAAAAMATGGAALGGNAPAPATETAATPTAAPALAADDRAYWLSVAQRLAGPPLAALANRRLKQEMPVEAAEPAKRREFSHLEALGRLLAGLAPWLESTGGTVSEAGARSRIADLARAAIDAATDPASPDFLNFSRGAQPLVDAAFLAQAILRAPTELWRKLDARAQSNVIAALVSSRPISPGENNWKLFATTIEVLLHRVGAARDEKRLFEGLQKHERWYVGDGVYGDGPEFHWDYYNSFVIQPMLVEALDVVGEETPALTSFREKARARLTRWAAIQERMIAPDGSFPVLGRSICYRAGAFHGLALAAWRHALPRDVSPAQARVALTRVIRKTMEAPGTWDTGGWLTLGLAGHQPTLAEPYVSTGSLYLSSFALLPLGLPPTDPFWASPPVPTTWEKVWSGQPVAADKALKG